MDSSRAQNIPNPREAAKPLSILFWWWTIDLFKKGYTKVLSVEDLYDPLKKDRSSILGDRLERAWEAQLKKKDQLKAQKPSLTKAIVRSFRSELLIVGSIHLLLEFVLRLTMPVFLGWLLQYFSAGSTTTNQDALIYASALSLNSLVTVIFANHMLFHSNYLGGRIRIAICSLVYRKALRLSKTALGETAPGKIVNLVANDVNRFEVLMWFLHFLWTAPISVIIVTYILYIKVKFAALFPILVFLMVVLIQVYMSKLSSKYRLRTAIKTDERIRLMDEIISGVQVIKMYAWEKPFCALVELARRLELKVVKKSSYLRGIYMTFFIFTTRLALYVTIASSIAFGEQLTAVKIFVISLFYTYLANTVTTMFVRGFAELSECKVSVARIQSFLMLEEFKEGSVIKMDQMSRDDKKHGDLVISEMQRAMVLSTEEMKKEFPKEEDDILLNDGLAVKMVNVTAKWCPTIPDNTLENINLNLERGKLYIVIGMVGSGKSSFLSSLLGELNLTHGSIHLCGNVSYVDQESWIFGASVRQNIIFGESFDRQRYQRVVKACSLFKDFAQFPDGDYTVVGERGSSLSGGQKARINLARAIYKQADVYLLDDPLSAVDAHVGKHLFDECIRRYLRGKTRILATHQLQFVKEVDGIILLDQGRMQYFDNYHRLLDKYPEYNCLIAADNEVQEDSPKARLDMLRHRFSSTSTKFPCISESTEVPKLEDDNDDLTNLKDIIESSSKGIAKGSMLFKYFRYGSNLCMVVVMCLFFVATQLFVSLNDYGVNYIINVEESRGFYASLKNGSTTNRTEAAISKDSLLPTNIYIYIYTSIVLSILVVGLIRSFVYYTVCLRSNERLHNSAFVALIRTSMRFFDTNPSGRILNRFSKDTNAIDELLPKALLDSGTMMLLIAGALIVTCCVHPIFIVPAAVVSIVCYWLRKIYLKTSKNIKRLEGMTRSPVFTHLNATLNGITTIRAYQAENILKEEFDKFQDVHTSSWYMFTVSSMAYAFFVDILVFAFTTFIIFCFLFLKGNLNGAQVGLAITQMMSIAMYVQWGMRQSAEVTNQMTAVERILEYTEIPPEKNLGDEIMGPSRKRKKQFVTSNSLIVPPKDWPSRGVVEFANVYLKYSDEHLPVLRDLSFRIEATQKIGIVGRTGAGKSSLITTMYRLAQIEGVIKIDDIDTGTMPVEELRSRISIIPQDPVLFSGTLRRNLDPFNSFDDEALWDALREVELKDSMSALGNGLDFRVFDRGSNFSVGQRQLVCLARAVLRNNRVLMLDEATANVDPQTDALIQRTIRKKFASCTVLTVAHRLNTIIDSDKVIVMDKGHVAEFDHPYVLLQNSKSQFTALVKETGPAMFEYLYQTANQCYNNKNNIESIDDDNK